jgi:hypothetical protein
MYGFIQAKEKDFFQQFKIFFNKLIFFKNFFQQFNFFIFLKNFFNKFDFWRFFAQKVPVLHKFIHLSF